MLSHPLPSTRGCFKVVSPVCCRIRHTTHGETFCLLNKQSLSSGLDLLFQKMAIQYSINPIFPIIIPSLRDFFFLFIFFFLKKGVDFFYPRSSDKGRSWDVYWQVKYKAREVQGDLIPQPYCQVENKWYYQKMITESKPRSKNNSLY